MHFDIWGPVPTPTMGRSRYFIIFIDDFSRFTWVYLMERRPQFLKICYELKNMIKTKFLKIIKKIR